MTGDYIPDYRPQWMNPTPKGFKDDTYTYFFDASNTPGLVTAVPAGGRRENIPLPLQAGAQFLWRGFTLIPTYGVLVGLLMRWKDPWGNYLSADYIPTWLCGYPSGSVSIIGGGTAQPMKIIVPFDPEVICPPSSLITIDLKNEAATDISLVGVTLYGVRRVAQ